jgi:hypothetical protein
VKSALVDVWSQLRGNVLWDVTYLLSVDVVDTDGVRVVRVAGLSANHDNLTWTGKAAVEPDADNSGVEIAIVNQLVNAISCIKLSRANGFANVIFVLVEPGLSFSFSVLLAATDQHWHTAG